jgi:hypothetical protein
LRKFSLGRSVLTALLFAGATFIHLYEGVALIAITMAVAYLSWRKGLVMRPALITLSLCAFSVAVTFIWLFLQYSSSGLPVTSWRAKSIVFSTLLISYPLAWGLIAWGIRGYWEKSGFDECFLLGWALGCITITLSGPFYPYPDRGTMTLQIPIYIIAGGIYFSRRVRVPWREVLAAILILGATPALVSYKQWLHTGFNPNAPFMFMSSEHREIIDILVQNAGENDLLLIDKSKAPWKTDDLWLAPEYPGKLYCGHFFLTVDYDRKAKEVNRFFESNPEEKSTFLKQKRIRFLFVNANNNPSIFKRVPGLTLLKSLSVGSLFEFKNNT